MSERKHSESEKNTKRKLLTLLAAVGLVLAGASSYMWLTNSTKIEDQSAKPAVTAASDKISFSDGGKQVTYTGEAGKTALANLQALTTVEVKSTSYGDMVTVINGVRAQDGKNYWAFYVNGAYANEGAGTYKTKFGDKLMWKLEDVQQ